MSYFLKLASFKDVTEKATAFWVEIRTVDGLVETTKMPIDALGQLMEELTYVVSTGGHAVTVWTKDGVVKTINTRHIHSVEYRFIQPSL